MSNIHYQRLESLRALMRARGWDAVIVSGCDPHGSEYPAARWKQVEWLTGFTGEAGDVVVTLDHAGLWADTRYFIQAPIQLEGSGFVLHKTRIPEQVLIPQWLQENIDQDAIVATDGLCLPALDAMELTDIFTVASVPGLLDAIWKDRPGIPQTPVFSVSMGETRSEKMEWLREYIREMDSDGILISSLDEVAWMLNVRASDIEYNPLCISYLLVLEDRACWFVLKDAVKDEKTRSTLDIIRSSGVEILPYSDAEIFLSQMREGRLILDSHSVNYHLWSIAGCNVLLKESPVALRKAIKNPTEIAGMKKAHIQDGIVMEKFLYWLESSVKAGDTVSEWDAAERLSELRREQPGFVYESFETISAYGPGAALPHYITPRDNAPILSAHGLYLCDSGGQYDCGTTDITRTVPLGECSRLEMEDYTLVLKGHIDLAMAVFPEETPGCRIDALAREPLWKYKRNFGHGTGHGVGCFLSVHEGPLNVRQNLNGVPLSGGMILSDEPGIYREGMHGVRHENLLLCLEDGRNEFGGWMRFEPLTLCHFDTGAIVPEMLGKEEKEWLNTYNSLVYRTLAPHLGTEIAAWLKEKTREI